MDRGQRRNQPEKENKSKKEKQAGGGVGGGGGVTVQCNEKGGKNLRGNGHGKLGK